jgi:hypothetical protein
VTIPASSPFLRFEGAPLVTSPYPNDRDALIPDPTLVRNHMFRVAFTCDCLEFEFVVQTRQSNYRVWVDGSWLTTDEVAQENHYPAVGFYKVQFSDKRARQVKIGLSGVPFYGLITHTSDTISPPQVPLGPRVIVFGDSWTGPTIVEPALPPTQPGGFFGSGYAQVLGEYFNWDWWEDGLGNTGFVSPGIYGITFGQRAQTDICGRSPDMVLVMGGINDNGSSEAVIEQAVTQFFSDIQACAPNAKIFFIGPQFTISGVTEGIHAAVASFSNMVYADPGTENWFYGSSTDPTTGNAYIYLNSHPTPLGHDYWAEKIANFIVNDLSAMSPQTFPLFNPAPAAGSFNYSATLNSLLPAGQQKLSVTFTPQDRANYTTVTQDAILIIEKANSSISLAPIVSSSLPGAALTLSSTVSPQVGGIPTGAVTFLDNGHPIGAGPLDQSGSAAYSTSALALGTHVITASYSGDGNFFGAETGMSVSVLVTNPDCNFSLDSTQLTVQPGQSGTTRVTVNALSGLSANLNISCSGLPANASCNLENGGQIALLRRTAKATVLVQAYTQRAAAQDDAWKLRGVELCGLLGFFLFLKRKNSRAFSGFVVSALLLLAGFSLMSGCGLSLKNIPAAPGTYDIRLTLSNAADASMAHSQTITVTIP